MTHYRVLWQIDVEAAGPREAAEKALKIQRDPESTATFFEVWPNGDPKDGLEIDLDDPDGSDA